MGSILGIPRLSLKSALNRGRFRYELAVPNWKQNRYPIQIISMFNVSLARRNRTTINDFYSSVLIGYFYLISTQVLQALIEKIMVSSHEKKNDLIWDTFVSTYPRYLNIHILIPRSTRWVNWWYLSFFVIPFSWKNCWAFHKLRNRKRDSNKENKNSNIRLKVYK